MLVMSNVEVACSMKASRAGGGLTNMISAVKENTLKLFCESKINRLINVLCTGNGCGHGAQQKGRPVLIRLLTVRTM